MSIVRPVHVGGPRHARNRPTWTWRRALIVVLAFVGGSVLAIPSASAWLGDVGRSQDIATYTDQLDATTAEERQALLGDALAYNRRLTDSPLSDPYVANISGGVRTEDEKSRDYAEQIAISPDTPMARLQIPAMSADLPIYHGTEEDTLAHGVGHLYGSSLPVGGSGSHAVLTAHNGYTGAQMFDELDQLTEGDRFSVTALGIVREYRIDRIEVVAPDQLDALRQIPGEEFVTLVTCTPRFLNTDRLLVRGVFVESHPEDPNAGQLGDAPPDPGLPWWILLIAAPTAASIFVARHYLGTPPDASERSS